MRFSVACSLLIYFLFSQLFGAADAEDEVSPDFTDEENLDSSEPNGGEYKGDNGETASAGASNEVEVQIFFIKNICASMLLWVHDDLM